MPADATDLPYSPACEENKRPILAVLTQWLTEPGALLEIGSGTGQHAVFFAPALPHLTWQPSDKADFLPAAAAWVRRYPAPNLLPPLELDVSMDVWPVTAADAVYAANVTHIMHWPDVQRLFQGVSRLLPEGGLFILYGPFGHGEHTAASNRQFDSGLRMRDPGMGVREIVDLEREAAANGLTPAGRHDMPRDNQILVWRKSQQ